ncbi:F-box domain-containing protein [Cephalotus follicularis]|uniref:F-box protein GID2 n=1 Tax=Cephalotus follicularis TaxID=3775 RepID=A0A1Q3CYX4_CEPFO|nr:F-box domain-containing protein [Cephalotus follicularis]
MKRTHDDSSSADVKMKKIKQEDEHVEEAGYGFKNLDEDLLFEVLKHLDARSLAMASCVSKQWHKTSQDERLWELICTKHSANVGCGSRQLRSVVLALGGFRRLHSLYLSHLSTPQPASSSAASSSSSSAWATFPPMIGPKQQARWGKDEVHVSLSLLSIQYYEKMNFSNRGR